MEVAREVPSRADRAAILQDFEAPGLIFGIILKLALWKALPWHLWGLGHHSKNDSASNNDVLTAGALGFGVLPSHRSSQ